ncbi:putative thiamine pyrophosphokinase [Thozetella sp. PMI_491]|nr:putative thiamine pyrophosphokinase [Thozetella sp. PMI_491]
MAAPQKTILDVVKECDNFPHPDEGDVFAKAVADLWLFFLPDDTEPHGYLIDSIVERMPWTSHFRIVRSPRKEVHLLKPEGDDWQAGCVRAVDEVVELARAQRVFPRLAKRRDEFFPIIGAKFPMSMDRSSVSIFGITAQGAHMTVYTRTAQGLKFWVPRRNPNKSTWPNRLDQAVAGGIAVNETPLECIVREAEEEAALEPAFLRSRIVGAGTVTWFNVANEGAGNVIGLMDPGILYVYDLEVAEDFVLRPVDDDIQSFHLMGVDEVKAAMLRGEFKPSCATVMVDFFVRHNLITPENEPDYVDIVMRLHRKLPFRTAPPRDAK